MTYSITARNPNDAFPITLEILRDGGVLLPSRNGPVLEYPEPVSVTFTHPRERCLFDAERDANPYLHFFEPLWILGGRRDVEFLARIVKRFRDYSDDGKTFAAAYGYRMRKPYDQVVKAIKRLKKNPADRQVVLQIRTPGEMFYEGKDTACNIAAALKVRDSRLNIHVFNRSNDAVWGGPAGGTNHPQFTMLQEYIAGHLGCGMGTYTVTTDSMHAYQNEQWAKLCGRGTEEVDDAYLVEGNAPFPMMQEPELFENDLRLTFLGIPARWEDTCRKGYQSLFFQRVFTPMWRSLLAYKAGEVTAAREALADCVAPDWKYMTSRWLGRRMKPTTVSLTMAEQDVAGELAHT